MFTHIAEQVRQGCRDQTGSVAVIFAICTFVLAMALGLAIDVGRIIHTKSRLVSAADASVLAAAKRMHDTQLSTADLTALARSFFDANMSASGAGFGKVSAFDVSVDRPNSSVSISVTADVPMTFARISGIENVSLPTVASAAFNPVDIEVSLSLDLTGSMCAPCTKIDDLKAASNDLVDILLPSSRKANKVRVALAPFAAGVNAGSFAALVTDSRSSDGCVFERDGPDQATDAAPGSGNFLKAAGDRGVSRTRNNCPSGSSIVPLTDSADTLRTAISGLRTGGSTAGHLGTAWAWYLLSPEWKSVWPAASTPTNYGDPKTIKAAILMTDGVYNTFGGACDRACSDISAEARSSQDLARQLCRGMRDKGVVVYAVGFMLSDPVAEEVLRDCAGSKFYRAENRETLRRAFSDIAQDLLNLRLSR